MRLQHKIGRQETQRLGVPVYAPAADAVGRHKRPPTTDRERGLVHLVAERKRSLVRSQEQLVANAVAQFVLHIARREISRRVAPRTALDGDDVEPFVGQFVRHDRTGPAEPDNDNVFFGESARHDRPQRVFGVHSARPAILTGGSGKRSLWRFPQSRWVWGGPRWP